DGWQTRMRQIRAEIDGWRELRAKIWEPFGPEDGAPKRSAGIGGSTGPSRAVETPDHAAIGDELERLTSILKDEGDSLRALARFLRPPRPLGRRARRADEHRQGRGGQPPRSRALPRPRHARAGGAAVALARARPGQFGLRHPPLPLVGPTGCS